MMSESAVKAYGRTFAFWLLPGIVAGVLASVFLSLAEYNNMADIAGSVIENNSLPEGIKQASSDTRGTGREFLEQYGYKSLGNMNDNVLFAVGISLLLFEGTGFILFCKNQREERSLDQRIRSLADYLKAVNYGKAGALTRTEDRFSYLEDEIYKTVMERKCMEAAAVRDHERLSLRIADVAHQLKTPLTSMALMTELMSEYQTEETREYMERLKNQVERLKSLVSGLLALAKLDSHTLVLGRERLDVAELIHMAAEPLTELMRQKEITFTAGYVEEEAEEQRDSRGGEAQITGDAQWTREALLNLLKNCVEHTPQNGHVEVSYRQNPLYTEITIEDSGPGFSKEDLPHLFERFYRGAGAAKDSAGIGLALAKLIIERQNGHILAENTPQGHARFQIKWYHS